MCDVRIEKVNNVFVRVYAEDAICKELWEYFSFSTPNHRFDQRVRERHWDGTIRLFNLKTKQIYVGLIPYIKNFCKQQGYSVDYLDEEESVKFPVDTKNLAKALSLPDNIEVRDYQYIASSVGLTKKRAIIVSPTGSGKSLIIYLMIRHLLNSGKKRGLLIVPTVNLVSQMHSDFQHYSEKNGWDVEKHCQKIYAGQTKIPETDLVISTWQSIFEMPKKYFEQFDFIIGDEAHTFKASSLTHIMKSLVNCDVRIGTTGTLDDVKVNKLVLQGLFGKIYKVTNTKTLMDRGLLADLEIKCVVLKYPKHMCDAVKNLTYQEEADFLARCDIRNDFVRDITLNLKGNTLVLFTFVEKHGKILFERIKEKAGDRKVFFIHGGVDAEEREQIRKITEQENDAIIIGSFGTMSTGVNIKRLHNLVFAFLTKSKIRTLQSIGRTLRIGEEKNSATLYDIVDDLRSGDSVNYALKHYEERMRYYSEEKFKITTLNKRIGQ
jgi:superfamily II DNA or RNA helicase